jgi:hypothetical protein
MTLKDAISLAKETAKKLTLEISVVEEGPHADEFEERDADGKSYGFCATDSVSYLYRYGVVVMHIDAWGSELPLSS